MLDAANCGFWDWTTRTGEVTHSRRWAEMLADGPSEVEPHYFAWAKLVHPDDRRAEEGRPFRLAGTQGDVSPRRGADDQLRQALARNEQLVLELRETLNKVRTLVGLLPICAWCKSVRNDEGYWERIEHYLSTHTEARVFPE